MQRLRSGFKQYIIIGFVFVLLLACKDIPRDNILDPKNPDSYRPQIILLEAFVNTENDQSYNEDMLSALNTILDRYPGKIILSQYHRNTTSYTDALAIPENETLYEQYVHVYDDLKGVPDVFINGTVSRVKGASSIESAIERIDTVIQPFLIENTFFTIEPTVTSDNSKISISTKIARLGSESISDIIVRAIVTEQIDTGIYTRVVRAIENSNLIPRLEPGEQTEIKFSDVQINPDANLQVTFSVKSNQSLIVHQSIEVVVP